MSFNSDPSNQGQEVIFSRKLQKNSHPPSIYFNNNSKEQVSSQKHLAMILDATLNFQEQIKNLLTKVNKTIGYKSCKTSCPENHYSQYLNRLSGLILITVMLYMTRVLTILFIRKWSQSNITQHWL